MPTTLVDRLTATQRTIDNLRERRATTIRDRDTYRAELEQQDTIDQDSVAFTRARDAGAQVNALTGQIEAAMAEEGNILRLIGGDQSGVGVNGNGPEDGALDAGTEILKAAPGRLLTSILERRKAAVSTLPDDLRRRDPAPEAVGFLTTANVSTITESQALIDLLAPMSVALASGVAQMRIDTTKQRIPRFTELPVADWIAERAPFPKSAPGIEMVDVTPPKAGLITPLSLEVFEDLRPLTLAMLQTQMLRAVALAYDRGILFGTGSNSQPRGVANTTGIAVVSQPLTGLAPFAQAIARLIGDNAFPGALVINPLDLGTMLALTEFSGSSNSNVPLWTDAIQRAANGAYALRLPYFGVPVWPTPAAPQGTALLYDPATILAVIRREADIALDPYYDFDNGDVGLRTYIRGDVVVAQPKGAVKITFTAAP